MLTEFEESAAERRGKPGCGGSRGGRGSQNTSASDTAEPEALVMPAPIQTTRSQGHCNASWAQKNQSWQIKEKTFIYEQVGTEV